MRGVVSLIDSETIAGRTQPVALVQLEGHCVDGLLAGREVSNLQRGDQVEALVIFAETDDGTILLSQSAMVRNSTIAWANEHIADGAAVIGTVVQEVRGGLQVDVGDGRVPAFLPGSHTGRTHRRAINSLIGQSVEVAVIEVGPVTAIPVVSITELAERRITEAVAGHATLTVRLLRRKTNRSTDRLSGVQGVIGARRVFLPYSLMGDVPETGPLPTHLEVQVASVDDDALIVDRAALVPDVVAERRRQADQERAAEQARRETEFAAKREQREQRTVAAWEAYGSLLRTGDEQDFRVVRVDERHGAFCEPVKAPGLTGLLPARQATSLRAGDKVTLCVGRVDRRARRLFLRPAERQPVAA